MELIKFEQYLVCPVCRSKLRKNSQEYICVENNHIFKTADNVPLLLNETDRAKFSKSIDQSVRMQREFKSSLYSKGISIVKNVIGSSLSLPLSKKTEDIIKKSEQNLSLNIGSGIVEGDSCQINLDIALFNNVDVVGTAENIPFEDNTFSIVKNIALLEHLENPEVAVREMHRVVKPGGYVYSVVPFMLHFHAYPNDFHRFTREGLKKLFSQFDIFEIGVRIGPGSTITTLCADWFELLSFSKNRMINDLLRLIPLILLFPLKFFDYVLVKNVRCHEVAQALYILCKKPQVL